MSNTEHDTNEEHDPATCPGCLRLAEVVTTLVYSLVVATPADIDGAYPHNLPILELCGGDPEDRLSYCWAVVQKVRDTGIHQASRVPPADRRKAYSLFEAIVLKFAHLMCPELYGSCACGQCTGGTEEEQLMWGLQWARSVMRDTSVVPIFMN